MFLERRRKDELRVGLVFDKSRGREPLDRLIVRLPILATPATIPLFHTTPASPIRPGIPTSIRPGSLPSHTKSLSGVQNRAVPRATTQIPVKGLLDVVLGGRVVVPEQGVEAHDDARGAEAALRAIALCDALLGRVGLIDVADALDGDDVLAVDRGEGREAGVDAGVVDLLGGWVVLRDYDCAGAAAALAAATGRRMLIHISSGGSGRRGGLTAWCPSGRCPGDTRAGWPLGRSRRARRGCR